MITHRTPTRTPRGGEDRPEAADETSVVAEGADPPSEVPDDESPAERAARLDDRAERLDQREDGLDKRAADLRERAADLDDREERLREHRSELDDREAELDRREARIEQREEELDDREARIEDYEAELDQRESELNRQQSTLESYVDDQLVGVEERLDETTRNAVSAAMANYSTGEESRVGAVGNVLVGLAGAILLVGGVANLVAGETDAFVSLLSDPTANIAASAFLAVIGLGLTLGAAANRV